MIKVTLYARDNDKPGNREVVAFIRQYMPQFVRAGIRFTFTVANPIEAQLVQRGIDKLPAIAIEQKRPDGAVAVMNHLTPVEIKNALLGFIGGPPAVRRSSRPRKPEDDLQDYYASEMNMDKYEADLEDGDDDPSKKDISTRIKAEMDRRQAEHDRRGPPKTQSRRRTRKSADEQTDQPPAPAARPASHPKTPQDRLRDAGGDPNNGDDAMLARMMECSDDI